MPSIPTLLTSLIVPQNLCLCLVLAGVLLFAIRQRRSGGLLIATGLGWVLVWSLPITSLWLGGALEKRYPYQPAAQLPTAQAIVVLGGNTANNRANWFEPYKRETATSRVETAAKLYLAGRAPKVVLSGGALEGNVSEAQGMAHAIGQLGVPDEALVLENDSRNTYENASLTQSKLAALGLRPILLVTSALHMPRAMAAFGKQGADVIPAPSPPQILLPADASLMPWLPDQRTLESSRSIIKEYAGLWVYWLRGWV